jgi:hypothetical protein
LLAKQKKVEPLEESPEVASDRKLSIPIEALGLAPRVYRLLKRNKMDTIDEIQQHWEKIRSLKNIGPVTLNQIQEALDEFKNSGNSIRMKREFLQSSQGVETPGHELRSIEDVWPIAPTATCYHDFNEIRIGALPLPPRVSRALMYNNINTIGQFFHKWHEINSFSRIGPAAIAQIRKAMELLWADIGSTSVIFEATSNSREVSSDVSKDDKIPIERSIFHLKLLEGYYPLLMNTGIYTIDQITCTRLEKLRSEKVLDTRLIRKIREAVQSWLDQDETRRIAYFELMNGEGMVPLSDGLDFEELLDGLMETLEPRWVKVLELRFGLKTGEKLTLEKIGKEHGVTRERIRRIEGEALNRLRQPSYLGDLRQSRIIAKMSGLIDQYGGLISESRLIDELQVKLDLNTYSMNGVAGLIKKIFEGNIRLYGSDIKLLYIPELCSWTASAWDTEPILNAADKIMDLLSRAKLPLPWEDLYTSLVQEGGLVDLEENLATQ